MSKYSWAKALAPGHMGTGRRRPPPPNTLTFPGGGGPAAAAHAPRAMGPCPCVQEPKLWPMSILTFGPISIFSIPDF